MIMSSSNLFKATVNEHLECLPKPIQSRLYEAPATCLSIYRLLPPLAKFYIMSMLFYEHPIALKDMSKWCKPTAKKIQFEALKRLRSLHLIEEHNKGSHLKLHQTFRKNFRDCLTGSQTSNAFGNLCTSPDKNHIDVKFLDMFASQKWESILHFMVGTELSVAPSKSVLSLLKLGGLMEGPGTLASNLKITNKGFQFLLQDVNVQIWTLLLQYLSLTQDLNMDPVDVLNFIFVLGCLELGKSYTVSSLSETQISMLADLKDYGLIYQNHNDKERFYPTRLATTLTSEAAALRTPSMALNQVVDTANSEATEEQMFSNTGGSIILETNFKIYAYTNSPLEIAILNLFVHLKTRFPNMVTGQITRESIRKALFNGITADQIIKFLESHAHSQMKQMAKENLDKKIEFDANNNINTATDNQQLLVGEFGSANSYHKLEVLPPTVVDQIKLWQLELDRIQTFEGYLFKDFSSQQEYDALRSYALELGVLLWSDKNRKKFFVTKDGMSQVADFANKNRGR